MDPPNFKNLTLDVVDGAIAIITLRREFSANSLHPDLLIEWIAAMRWVIAVPEISVVVQTSAGKFFCTGMDFDNWPPPKEELAENMDSFIANFKVLNELLITCDKVLIAAVNGPCAGYGVTCLALYDLVYAVPSSYYFCPFLKWGFSAEGCSTLTFPQIMGHQKASALLLAGERMSAGELSAAGLITKVVGENSLMKDVMEVATRISRCPPGAPAATKNLMLTNNRERLLSINALECVVLRTRLHDPACQAAAAAFTERKQKRAASRL
ncbi:hypothetical protein MRS44_011235 [Fusarium solani]|uniref:uncharacterized protein n=1 Tax=Fusarium solani TaxID=169388 RepID=UPI0032C4523E|nr:hypothetical protein MRS44_011235 [Fusarium solani]